MVLIAYQIILFLIISLSYYLTLNHFMAVTVTSVQYSACSQPYFYVLPTL